MYRRLERDEKNSSDHFVSRNVRWRVKYVDDMEGSAATGC